MKLVWLPGARNDMQKIYDFLYDTWGIKIAEKFLELIDEKVSRIEAYPFSYPSVIGIEGYRRALIHPNVSLYYKISGKRIIIASLHDNRQNPKDKKI